MRIYELDEACWKGYKQLGMKKKGKRTVPNCVPKENYQSNTHMGMGSERVQNHRIMEVAKEKALPAHAPKGAEWDRLPEWKKEWYRKWTPSSQGVCKHPQAYHEPSRFK